MKRYPVSFLGLIVISIFLFVVAARAQEPWYAGYGGSQQSTAGGATVQAVTAIVNNPFAVNPAFSVIPSPPPPPPGAPPAVPPQVAGTTDVEFQSIYSRHVQIYSVPLSYAFTDNFKIGLSIPYVHKTIKGEYTGEELSVRGLGDISLGVKYRYGDKRAIRWMTSFNLKLPTGENKQFENRQEQLALGTGSYDFIVNQTVTGLFGNFILVGNVGYAFNTGSDYTETNNWGRLVKYENNAGNAFNYLVGAEYYTPVPKLMTYMNAAGLIMGRSHIKETYLDGFGGNRNEDKKDRMKTLDLITGVKYMFTETICVRLGVIIPVWTRFDPDAVDTQDRELLLDFGFSARF